MPERIGFPEPAAAAVLELVDKMLRLARLLLEPKPLAPGLDEASCADDAVSEENQDEDRDAAGSQRAGEQEAPAIETIMLTSTSGGELIDAIVRIAMPAAIAIGAAAIGATNVSSATLLPNHVHRAPANAR